MKNEYTAVWASEQPGTFYETVIVAVIAKGILMGLSYDIIRAATIEVLQNILKAKKENETSAPYKSSRHLEKSIIRDFTGQDYGKIDGRIALKKAVVKKLKRSPYPEHGLRRNTPQFTPDEENFFDNVYQYLMNQMVIMEGLDDLNPGPNWFRITIFGEQYLDKIGSQEEMKLLGTGLIPSSYMEKLRAFYPEAYQQWNEAYKLFFEPNPLRHSTTIGHNCRQAIEDFIDTLFKKHHLSDPTEKSKTKSRLKALIALKKDSLGKTKPRFLEALRKYFETLNSLIQKQVHGGQEEKEALVLDDARRVILHTLIVMYELDVAFKEDSKKDV